MFSSLGVEWFPLLLLKRCSLTGKILEICEPNRISRGLILQDEMVELICELTNARTWLLLPEFCQT